MKVAGFGHLDDEQGCADLEILRDVASVGVGTPDLEALMSVEKESPIVLAKNEAIESGEMDALEEVAGIEDRPGRHGGSCAENGLEDRGLLAEDELFIVEKATRAGDHGTRDEESREGASDVSKCEVTQGPGEGGQRDDEDGQ